MNPPAALPPASSARHVPGWSGQPSAVQPSATPTPGLEQSTATPPPDHAELVRWAAAVAAAGASAADQNRRLARPVVDAVVEAGFARHFVPARWGGAAGGFGDLVTAAADLAEGCGSSGWCAALWAAHGRIAAYLPDQGQRDLWGRTPDAIVAAAILPPAGSAVATGDGWLLRGEWDWASGVEHADWALLAARTSSSRGPGRIRVFAVPRAEFGVRDTWQATGLRGSASNTIVVREAFVPDHRSLWLDEVLTGDGGRHRERCHRVPAYLVAGVLLCAPALGVARRALTLWSQWAARPVPGGAGPLVASAAIREVFVRTSAEIETAGLLLAAAADRADAGPVGADAIARNRRDAAFAADTLVVAVERLFRTGGAHVRAGAGELQRCWRDLHTATSHASLRWETAVEDYATSAAPQVRSDWWVDHR